ncbi:MAG: helicase HerA-like domain-containing protein [Saprospiraceae bacterium]
MKEKFTEQIVKEYSFQGESLVLGCGMYDKELIQKAIVRLPLKTMNRHGLIAGATGTGKTKSLQLLAEQLSNKSVPCVLLDIKGDLSGIAEEGVMNSKISERQSALNLPWTPTSNFVELFSISDERGTRLRATVSEFGPVLLSKILGLNDTQESVISLVFKYCDDRKLLLLDLEDLKSVLQYITNAGKEEIEMNFGSVSSASVGTIFRKVIELEQQGAAQFFGEKSFDVHDLLRFDDQGRGVISIMRATDIQDRPKFFSTFLLQLLAELYAQFPELGDVDKPKLCFFIDEAHLLFEESNSALVNQLETIIKLIRSKGIGVFFITQNPVDVPDSILAQLGMKIQHALRAFTAKDRKSIKLAAENYPETEYYSVESLITELGIGEALVTVLNERGIPSSLVHTMMQAPQSRMDILTADEMDSIVKHSKLASIYNEEINRESAFEILQKRFEKQEEKEPTPTHTRPIKEEISTVEKVMNSPITKQVGRTVARELTRGLLGVFGIKTGRGKTWF